MALPKLTLGIEEEYQIIHPETREVISYIQQFLDRGRLVLRDQIKSEFLQSQVEVGSTICNDVGEARRELVRLRRAVRELADSEGLWVAAAGTHPFSSWTSQLVSAGERYAQHETNMADVARQMLVFGMHVHVGIEDREILFDVMNQSRYFLPHLLALSSSSPFWQGRDTGLKSYRSIVIGSLPRAGLPPSFPSAAAYDQYVATLIKTGCIDEPSKIWWDVRPSPKYPTLEYRIFDICTRLDEALCLAALLQGIVGKLILLRQSNIAWRDYRRSLIAENKWRAVRYGVDARLIDFGQNREVEFPVLLDELLAFIDDVADELRIRRECEFARTLLKDGTSADRQLRAYRQGGDLKAVVDHLVRETSDFE